MEQEFNLQRRPWRLGGVGCVLQVSPKPELRAFPSLGRNSPSPREERGIWQGARMAAWHPELAASSPGWGRGVSPGTRCGENC